MSATNRGAIRRINDAYYTPAEAAQPLIDRLKGTTGLRVVEITRPFTILEPCAGPGSLLEQQLSNSFPTATVVTLDLAFGQDFLTFPMDTRYDFCITNPPYSLAREFVEKALLHSNNVALLLRLNFLGSRKRREWWQVHLPRSIIVLSKRPSFTGGGTDATEYAWFCWGDAFLFFPPIIIA